MIITTIQRSVAVAALLLAGLAHAVTSGSSQTIKIHHYSIYKETRLNSIDAAEQRSTIQLGNRSARASLKNNTQVIEQLPSNIGSIQLLRGQLENNSHSWIRLTRSSQGTQGLIWDGADLYVIAPAHTIATQADLPIDTDQATVIFKLSDTTVDLGDAYCGSDTHVADEAVRTGLATYQALTAELTEQAATTAPTLRLEIQALADAAFRSRYTSDTEALDALLVRINNVDGIFEAQLSLQVQATKLSVYDTDPQGLSTTTSASSLLESLSQLRKNSAAMQSYAATHLFTGRNLDGDTLGIAYIGKLCNARYAVSLSEVRDRGAWIDSLVLAHELGHQLGAVHDGEGLCASTNSSGFLMSPTINGSSEFSSCSLQSLFATLQSSACLVPIGAADIALNDLNLTQNIDTKAQWSLPISNIGIGEADTSLLHLTIPAGVIISASSIAGGSCVNTSTDGGGGAIDCVLNQLAANEIRYLNLTLFSAQLGTYLLTATIDSISDSNTENNSATYTLLVSNQATTAEAATSVATTHGGGAWNEAWLSALLLLLGGRLWRARQHTLQPLH